MWPTVLTVSTMIFSFYFLVQALKTILLETAYAVWTHKGAAGTVIFKIYLFDEPKAFARVFLIFLIVIGIVGRKLFAGKN